MTHATRRSLLLGGLSLALPVPALSQGAEFRPPAIGARWAYEERGMREDGERLPDREWEGRTLLTFLRIGAEGTFLDLFLRLSGAWVVTLTDKGRAVAGASPNNFALDWPLSEGKRWVAGFTAEDYAAGTREETVIAWEVVRARDFATPFGTVRAFGLRGESPGVLRQNWFAPGLGVYYRQTVEEAGRVTFDRVLVDFEA